MRLTDRTVDTVLDSLTEQLNGGSLTIYAGNRPSDVNMGPGFQQVLARIPFQSLAFAPSQDGRALANELPESLIQGTGQARWGQIETRSGAIAADVTVRTLTDPDADRADVLLDRADLQQGGLITISRLTLSLPTSS